MEGLIGKQLQTVNMNKRENINDNGNEFQGYMFKKNSSQEAFTMEPAMKSQNCGVNKQKQSTNGQAQQCPPCGNK